METLCSLDSFWVKWVELFCAMDPCIVDTEEHRSEEKTIEEHMETQHCMDFRWVKWVELFVLWTPA